MPVAERNGRKGRPEAIQERHSTNCAKRANEKARCNCTRTYRSSVYDHRTKKRDYGPGWSADKGAVEKWRAQALRELAAEISTGTPPAGTTPTLSEAWADWYAGAKSGAIANRNGERYKARALESYERAWRLHLKPDFGGKRIGAVSRRELQKWTDEKAKAGMPRSSLNNALDPLRVLFRFALRRSIITVNPTADLELPAGADDEMRFATKAEAERFIAALPAEDKALWASAFYAGLRRGELQALRWSNVDLGEPAAFTVLRAWSTGEDTPKSKAGVRRVPIVPSLKALLEAQKERTGRGGNDLVFGRTASDPFVASTARARALKAWKDLPLEPITLHQCRHTAASLMIAAGANAKALSVVMGHASIEITFNRYGHLMPGSEDHVGQLLAQHLAA
jgi:integrase